MKLLCALVVLLGTVAAPAAAYASDSSEYSYCYIGPKTVTVDGHSVSTPSVRVPCPQGTD